MVDAVITWFYSRAAAKEAGEKFWDPVVPCAKGHVAPRYVISNLCRECVALWNRSRKAVDYQAAYRKYKKPDMAKKAHLNRLKNIEKYRQTQRDYYTRNREQKLAHNRTYTRYRKYGMTKEGFEALLVSQSHQCPICGVSIDHSAHVDHDHTCCATRERSCGKCVRGLLCHRCNHLLGQAKDDPQILISAVRYLTRAAGLL